MINEMAKCTIEIYFVIIAISSVFICNHSAELVTFGRVSQRACMVNGTRSGGWASWYIGYLLCVILWVENIQTLHSFYLHIEDVHAIFWKCSDIFSKNLQVIFPTCFEYTVPTLCNQLLLDF
jgi:hypothetical protein